MVIGEIQPHWPKHKKLDEYGQLTAKNHGAIKFLFGREFRKNRVIIAILR